ncbi:MAG: hypothetical protein ABIJ97_00045, partial [Bacteroidota bacterium]
MITKRNLAVFIFIGVLFLFNLRLNAQCGVTAAVNVHNICLGDCVNLSATGDCTEYLMDNDFNNGTIGTGWTSNAGPMFTNPCPAPVDGTIYLWIGPAMSQPRDLTTVPYNISTGCQICFDMVYATQSQSSPCEGPDLPAEGVHLQYSLNGTNWVDINYWPPDNPNCSGSGGYDACMTVWNNYCENVPAAAASPNTQFQWHQDQTSSNSYDHWGIDNVQIFCPPPIEDWVWNNGIQDFYFDQNPPQQCPPAVGQWIYTVTLTDGTYTGLDTIIVNVETSPNLVINYTNNLCVDATPITLTSNSGNVTFSGPGVTGTTFNPATAGPGNHTITATYNGLCPTSVDSVIHVFALPTAHFTAQSVCANDPTTITYTGNAGSGATYNWIFSGGTPASASGQGPHIVTWATDGTFSITCTVTDANGCTQSETNSIIILPLGSFPCCIMPTPNAGSDNTVCGLTYTLDATPSWGIGTWTVTSVPGGGVATYDPLDAHSQASVTVYGTYEFTWTEDNGISCADSDPVSITFVQLPNANAGNNQIVCGTSANLNGTQSVTGSNISWTSLPGGASFSPATSAVTTATGTYGTYQMIITETNSICIDKDTTEIQFLQIPTPDAGIDQSVCGNSAQLLGVLSNPSNTGYWTEPSGNISFAGAGGIYNPNATAIAATFTGNQVTYTLTWHETNGTCDGSDPVDITFIKPPLANAGYGGDVCDYEFTLMANITGVTYTSAEWTSSAAGITIFDSTNDTTLVDVSAILPGAYALDNCAADVFFYWTVISGTGCNSVDSVMVKFYNRAESFAGTNDSVCGLVYTMQAIPSIDCSEGQWSVISQPSGSSPANFTPVSSPNSLVTATAFGYWEFEWFEWHQNSPICNSRDTVRIHFIEKPTIDAGPRDTVCGHWAQMNATTSGYSGTWITPGGGYIFASGPSLTLEDTSYQHVYNT